MHGKISLSPSYQFCSVTHVIPYSWLNLGKLCCVACVVWPATVASPFNREEVSGVPNVNLDCGCRYISNGVFQNEPHLLAKFM